MLVRTVWRIKLDGRHRVVQLSHNTFNGSGVIYVDRGPRQIFGARVEPTSNDFTFEIDRRQCIVRIQLMAEHRYRYECEVNGTVLIADTDRSAPSVTLLRAAKTPSAPTDDLLRPAATGAASPANELLLPHADSPES